jgi:hypothetical protein
MIKYDINDMLSLSICDAVTYNKFDKENIKKVIFNPPATIVIFKNGSKRVVKCDSKDEFNPEIGFAMAMMNEMFGSRSAFKKFIKKHIKK